MKKFKIGAMALALTLGVAGAFATTSAKNSKLLNPNWQTVDASTGATIAVSAGGVYDPNRTVAQAKADYGCPGNADYCAGTVSSQDAQTTPSSTFIRHQ
jgi:hypothetical protein